MSDQRKKKRSKVSLKDYELIFVTENNPEIHYAKNDYIHVGQHNSAWEEDVLKRSKFVERWMAEQDSSILQLIPYIVCFKGDRQILSYQRSGGGEGRLEKKYSIGIGGHVNSDDKVSDRASIKAELEKISTPNSWDIVIRGAAREIIEETSVPASVIRDNLIEVGTIYTPSDGSSEVTQNPKVGEVHIGIIYFLNVPNDIKVNKLEGLINPAFTKGTPDNLDQYETWSRMVYENIDPMFDIYDKKVK